MADAIGLTHQQATYAMYSIYDSIRENVSGRKCSLSYLQNQLSALKSLQSELSKTEWRTDYDYAAEAEKLIAKSGINNRIFITIACDRGGMGHDLCSGEVTISGTDQIVSCICRCHS